MGSLWLHARRQESLLQLKEATLVVQLGALPTGPSSVMVWEDRHQVVVASSWTGSKLQEAGLLWVPVLTCANFAAPMPGRDLKVAEWVAAYG